MSPLGRIVTVMLVGTCLHGPMSSRAQFLGCQYIQQLTLEACQILEKLYNHTNGRQWFNASGWLRSNQPCDWYGITCASGAWPRSITKIHLSGNNLTGELPGELSLLTQLRELVIDNSGRGVRFKKLTSNIPAVLGAFPHLEMLILSENELVGTIPAELGNLSNLRILKLDGNKLTGPVPAALGQLDSLEELDLSNNSLAGSIPEDITTLPDLRILSLSNNLLTGIIPPELGALTTLIALDLSGNDLTGVVPAGLTKLGGLIRLSLADNQLRGPLTLNMAAFMTGRTSCFLEGNTLCLPDAPPYDALEATPLCGLKRDPACSLCTDVREPASSECRGLEQVYLATDGAQWTNSSNWLATTAPCDWFGVTCTSGAVTELSLPANNLTGHIPIAIDGLPDLKTLDLSDNAIAGEIPEELGRLEQLERLNLSVNQLSGSVSVPVAALGATIPACNLLGNDPRLCIPDRSSYQSLGVDPICGLALSATCTPGVLARIASLAAQVTSGEILLTWSTNRPSTNRFDVEVKDNGAFRVIGSADTPASQDQPLTYSFVVTGLPAGQHVLRLHQHAPSGASHYSEEVSVLVFADGHVVMPAFPNPFHDTTSIPYTADTEEPMSALLYDATGRRVRTLYHGTPRAHQTITLRVRSDNLVNGLYYVRVIGPDGIRATQAVLLLR